MQTEGFIPDVWKGGRVISGLRCKDHVLPDLTVNQRFRRKDGKSEARLLRLVWKQASENCDKVIILEEIEGNDRRGDALRLRYYIIGEKGRMKGKWAFGQFATIIMPDDLRQLLFLAKKHGMI